MNEIKIFENPAFGKIRTAGTSEEPLFCLADICRVLGINNATDAKKRLKEDGVDSIEVIDSMGRTQRAHFINEQNLYRLIMRSDKPIAEPFQDWVCGDVLPSIRKTGKYGLPQTFAEALRLAAEQQEKIERQQKALQESAHEIVVLNGVVMQMQPKVTFADAIVGSKASCLVGELAKVLTQNGITIGQNKLFEWLRNNGYLGKKGERYNIPNQQYVEQGLFEIKKGVRSGNDGVMHTTITTKVTGKGQCYFINKFKNTSAVK
jgi:phage antirepressor YoqD-like protein